MLCSDEPESLDYPSGQRGLGGHLAMWDPHGLVVVCHLDLIKGHEGRPRHPTHRVEYARAVPPGPPTPNNQLFPSTDLVVRCSESALPHRVNARLTGDR